MSTSISECICNAPWCIGQMTAETISNGEEVLFTVIPIDDQVSYVRLSRSTALDLAGWLQTGDSKQKEA